MLRKIAIEMNVDDEIQLKVMGHLIDESILSLKDLGEKAREMYGEEIDKAWSNPFEALKIEKRILVPRVGRVLVADIEDGPIVESILTYLVNHGSIKSWEYVETK